MIKSTIRRDNKVENTKRYSIFSPNVWAMKTVPNMAWIEGKQYLTMEGLELLKKWVEAEFEKERAKTKLIEEENERFAKVINHMKKAFLTRPTRR